MADSQYEENVPGREGEDFAEDEENLNQFYKTPLGKKIKREQQDLARECDRLKKIARPRVRPLKENSRRKARSEDGC